MSILFQAVPAPVQESIIYLLQIEDLQSNFGPITIGLEDVNPEGRVKIELIKIGKHSPHAAIRAREIGKRVQIREQAYEIISDNGGKEQIAVTDKTEKRFAVMLGVRKKWGNRNEIRDNFS